MKRIAGVVAVVWLGIAAPADATVTSKVGTGAAWPTEQAASGNGPRGSVLLNRPGDIAPHPAGGYVFIDNGNVVGSLNSQIRWVNTAGNVIRLAGGYAQGFCGDGGPSTSACLNAAHGVSVLSDGSLLIADTFNNRIRYVSAATGTISTIAGNGGTDAPCPPRTDPVQPPDCANGLPATQTRLHRPVAVAPLTPAGNGYLIVDQGNHRIRWSTPAGTIVDFGGTGAKGFAGDGGAVANAVLDTPADAKPLPGGGYLISDARNCRIRRVSSTGTISTIVGSGPAPCWDNAGLAQGATTNPTSVRLGFPGYMSVASDNSFVFSDQYENRLFSVNASNTAIQRIAGEDASLPDWNGDGPNLTRRLAWPSSVMLTEFGTVFTDTGNNRVRFADGYAGASLGPAKITAKWNPGIRASAIVRRLTVRSQGTQARVECPPDLRGRPCVGTIKLAGEGAMRFAIRASTSKRVLLTRKPVRVAVGVVKTQQPSGEMAREPFRRRTK